MTNTAARQPNSRPYWLIEGFDGLTRIHEWKVDARSISEEAVQHLLRALTAKVGLTPDEIVGAYTNRRSRAANGPLQVRREGPYLRFSCGDSPFFTAVYTRGTTEHSRRSRRGPSKKAG